MNDRFALLSGNAFRLPVAGLVALAAVACGSTGAPSDDDTIVGFGGGTTQAKSIGCTTDADCPSGSRCVPSGSGELQTNVCTSPSGSPAGESAGSAPASGAGPGRSLPPDVCSSNGVGGLRMKLLTSEAVSGTVVDELSGKALCGFSEKAGEVVVNLAFFANAGCALPTAGSRWLIRLVGVDSHNASYVGLSYNGGLASGTGASVDYLGGGIKASGTMPLDHFWINNRCDGPVSLTTDAPIGAAQAGVPLAAIEITIGS